MVDLDLEKFLDRVNHECRMARLAVLISDKRMLKLPSGVLTAGIMEDGLRVRWKQGPRSRSS